MLTTDDKFQRSNSGLWLPEIHIKRRRRPTGIDLFCGCGGFSLGFIEAGFEVVAACDSDPFAAITYLYNLGAYPVQMHFVTPEDGERLEKAVQRHCIDKSGDMHKMITSGGNRQPDTPGVEHFWFGDIRKVSGQEILDTIGMKQGEVDCVFGGPPCQGFSRMGKRNIMDPRNSLVFDFARLVIEIMPKTICMENVPDIVTMVTPEGLPVIDAFCRVLGDGGFGNVDGIKKALMHSAGMGAAFQQAASPSIAGHRPKPAKNPKDSKAELKQESKQMEIFG